MNPVKKIKDYLMHYTWDLAFYDEYEITKLDTFDPSNLIFIRNPYKKKWFADPFILENREHSFELLVEEFDSDVCRGRIARLKVDKKNRLITDCKIILDLPTHLSFPAIYRVDGRIYVMPENSATGKSFIYEYDAETGSLKNPVCVLEEPITDGIISRNGDTYTLLATLASNPNGCVLREYTSKSIFGPYCYIKEHFYNDNKARMAGHMIRIGTEWVRPAQDCNGAYGKAVVLYKGQDVVKRLSFGNSWLYSGIHTFNTEGTLLIVDAKKYDFSVMVRIINQLKSIYAQIKRI